MQHTRPVWIEINLDHLAHNIQEVRRVTHPGTKITAVIKADGYGHGACEIAKTLLENGADRLAVATLSEAITLRKAHPMVPILVLGYTPDELGQEVLAYGLTQTVYTFDQARAFNALAMRQATTMTVHLKIDTGMSRLGFQTTDGAIEEVLKCYALDHLTIEGVYTHFACADEVDKGITHDQVQKYLKVTKAIEEAGYRIPIKHVSNSAAIIDLPEYNFDMVRAGIMLYGLYPSKDVNHEAVKLKEVMSLKAQVSLVKTMSGGEGVSYGHTYHCKEGDQIATLPLGYADGFTRLLTAKTDVIVAGVRRPIVGKICMDQCMVDVTGLKDVKRDTVVTLFGTHEACFKSIDEVADAIGTINYEIVCMIDKRVPRLYVKNNEPIAFVDDMLRLSSD